MEITQDTTEDKIRARRFTVDDDGKPVPGIVWTPAGAKGARPKEQGLRRQGATHRLRPVPKPPPADFRLRRSRGSPRARGCG